MSNSPWFGQLGPTIQLDVVSLSKIDVYETLQCWPRAAITSRHVREVRDNQTMVVSSFALDPNTLASWTVGIEDGCCVDSHVHLIALHLEQAL